MAVRRIALDGRRFPLQRERLDTVRPAANAANGMALDGAGRLVVCEQGCHHLPARISRMDQATGAIETLAAAWRGLPLNSPNDVVVAGDGAIWFTDPSYGHLQGFRPPPAAGDHVYRLDPHTGRAAVVADGFDKPNGLAFSADESVLYVGDSGANQEPGSFYPSRPHRVLAFDVRDGRHLERGRLFAVIAPGIPDGIKVDSGERVYVSCATGVLIFNPAGDLIGEIRVPRAVDFTFGGADRDVLFITVDTRVWAAELAACGPAPETSDASRKPTRSVTR